MRGAPWSEADALDELLRRADREPPPPAAGLEERILARYERQRRHGRSRRWGGIALAAALLIALQTWLALGLQSSSGASGGARASNALDLAIFDREVAPALRRSVQLELLAARLERLGSADTVQLPSAPAPERNSEPEILKRYFPAGGLGLGREERVALVRLALVRLSDERVLGREYLRKRYRELARQYAETHTAELALADLARRWP